MLYRKDKNGTEISQLGYGCMRFSRKGTGIDLEKAEKELMTAFKAGVNYYDTAYIYPGSEVALGEIVKRNGIREKIHIATKLPQYLISSTAQIEKYFQEQLSRLQTDYVDYYLMHMLTDIASWHKLKDLGILQWIEEKKASGAIRNLGFSFHGDTDMFLQILNDYDWDFCQIQYNYMDENTQAGVEGLKAAGQKGIPVVIMEPLRGGKLVELPSGAKQLLAQDPKGRSAARLAFEWLWNQPEVTCVLSGMNSEQMVLENVKTASEVQAGDFTEADFELIEGIKEEIRKTTKVNCTGCRYCMPCPRGVDIPGTFRCYNHMYSEGKGNGRSEFIQTIALQDKPGLPSLCVQCGKCEKHCPQNIPIIETLKQADKALQPWYYKVAAKFARKFVL